MFPAQPSLSKEGSNSGTDGEKMMLFNCIHCEEDTSEVKGQAILDKEFSEYDGIKDINEKEFRVCQYCLNKIILDLQSKISEASNEIKQLQEKKEKVIDTITQSRTKFHEEDIKVLEAKEQDLTAKIAKAEQQKDILRKETTEFQNIYCAILKEEIEQDDKILELERQILSSIEQQKAQDRELKQIQDQIDQLQSEDFLRSQFQIVLNSQNTINGFQLTIPTEKTLIDFNQGMGQLTLLFTFLMQRLGYNPRKIKQFHCNGAVSKVERSQGLCLDLYCKLNEYTSPTKKSSSSKGMELQLYIPFEGLREFSSELLEFFQHISTRFAKNFERTKEARIQAVEFERVLGELKSKYDNKATWDFFFFQLLLYFDVIMTACRDEF